MEKNLLNPITLLVYLNNELSFFGHNRHSVPVNTAGILHSAILHLMTFLTLFGGG